MTLRPIALTLIAAFFACHTTYTAETIELYHACKTGNIPEVQRLMGQPDKDKLLPLYGFNVLHIAAGHNRPHLARFLITECRYDVDCTTPRGQTPLSIACEHGHLDIVKFLVQAGADPHKLADHGGSPIALAAANGFLEIIKFLASRGVNLRKPTSQVVTPFYMAAQNGHLELVKYLIKMNAAVGKLQSHGTNALHTACFNGHPEVARCLLNANLADINERTNSGATALMIAAQEGHLSVVRLLVQAGANLETPLNNGATPLYIATQEGHLSVVRLLVQGGANLKIPSNNGVTPLYIAAQKGHLKIVNYLIYNGADINTSFRNFSPLRIAIISTKPKIAQLLIRKGATVSPQDLETARQKCCFIEIIAGVTDYLQPHPEELPKYRTVMQRVIDANSQNLDEWLKTEKGTLCAAVCQILFPDINTSPQFVLTGKLELRRLAWAKESLIKQKGLARDIANRIFDDFLSMPKTV